MSKLEEDFALQLKAAGIGFVREYPFAKSLGRKWRADFMILDVRCMDDLLVEVQGIGPQGRHGSWGHIESDAEKFSTAAALGWRVLIVTGKMVKSGLALTLVEATLGLRPVPVKVKKPRRSKAPKRVLHSKLPERVLKAARRSRREVGL